jgi:endonuclease-3
MLARDRASTWPPEQVRELVEQLESRYGRREWTARFDPMDELVSCILSQHTSDSNSLPAFFRLREILPTWEEVEMAGEARVAEIVRSAGLANQKAKSILACLREIRDRTGSFSIEHLRDLSIPEARAWLESLPGVGPKTASIVLCFAFGMDAIPVDTHIFRVAWRLGLIERKIGEAKAHDVLPALVPRNLAFRFHVSLIQHGRAVCKAPLPKCEECVVVSDCAWFAAGGPERRREEVAQARKRAGVGAKRDSVQR